MGKNTPFEALEDLKGIRACLSYVEQELEAKELRLAAHFIGAACYAIQQDIDNLKVQSQLDAERVDEIAEGSQGHGLH